VLLIVAGNQVPLTPFGEIGANIGATVPAQNAGIVVKLVTNVGVTITFNI